MQYLFAVLTFTACSVKDTDTTTQKALKHTANAPLYVVVGVGAATKAVIVGAIALPIGLTKYGINKLSEDNNSSDSNVTDLVEAEANM